MKVLALLKIYFLGIITLAACLLFNIFAKSYSQQLSVLFCLIVGNILAIFMGKVDLSVIFNGGLIALSHLLPFKMKFDSWRDYRCRRYFLSFSY